MMLRHKDSMLMMRGVALRARDLTCSICPMLMMRGVALPPSSSTPYALRALAHLLYVLYRHALRALPACFTCLSPPAHTHTHTHTLVFR